MDNLDFSEEEIQEQLTILGYKNIPKHRLREFKKGWTLKHPLSLSKYYHIVVFLTLFIACLGS